ncbi:MAG: hypothetical protein LBL33_07130, partial [Tannerella sp.]|nr:hypothetical protein [Tannerella sp.]
MKTYYYRKTFIFLAVALAACAVTAQTQSQLPQTQPNERLGLPAAGDKTLLNGGWYARRANEVRIDGNQLTAAPFSADGWMKARVPGTVLT